MTRGRKGGRAAAAGRSNRHATTCLPVALALGLLAPAPVRGGMACGAGAVSPGDTAAEVEARSGDDGW